MSEPVFGLPYAYRHYRCTGCGYEKEIGTNHTDRCADYCQGCSWQVGKYPIAMYFGGQAYRMFEYAGPPVEESPEKGPEKSVEG